MRPIGNPFARNGRWTSKTEEKLRLYLVNRNPYARNEDVGRQELRKNCDCTWSIATLSHEMDVGRQKLRKNCDGRFPLCKSVCM